MFFKNEKQNRTFMALVIAVAGLGLLGITWFAPVLAWGFNIGSFAITVGMVLGILTLLAAYKVYKTGKAVGRMA